MSDVDRGRVEPGYCDRCGHTFAEHAEAGICTFTCDCYQPGDFCGCDRSDLNEAGDVDRGRVAPTLQAWIQDIKTSRGTVQRQLIIELMTAIDKGEFDGETIPR
jgi:hypothetical protein